MAFDRLESLVKKLTIGVLTSLTISCGGCNDDKLTEVHCDPTAYEICNNYDSNGKPWDDNCNGTIDEFCDEDGDGYCTDNPDVTIVYSPNFEPSVCPKTFQNCTPGEECPDELLLKDCIDNPVYFQEECADLPVNIDCSQENYSTCAQCIYPGAVEYCDFKDNDCNKIFDDNFIERGELCGDELGENFELDSIGICTAGIYTECFNGQLICTGYQGPLDAEKCNGISDTCGKEMETIFTEAEACYYEYREDGFGNMVKFDLGINHPSIGNGNCMAGGELCIGGIVGGDNICHGAVLPRIEVEQDCDCIDDNCNGEIDEGLHTEIKQEFAFVIDNSCSMSDKINYIINQLSNTNLPDCFSDKLLKASTILLGERNPAENLNPLLRRSLVSMNEFKRRLRGDIPTNDGPGLESSLNAIVYTSCAYIEQSQNENEPIDNLEICDLISAGNSLLPDNSGDTYNSFGSLNQNIYSNDSERHIIVLSDEAAQWFEPTSTSTVVNQQQAAEIAYHAGIKVTVFTHPGLDSYNLDEMYQGFAYFRDYGGDVRNINDNSLKERIEEIIIDKYCPQTDEN
jgi:hypothetical protein